MAIPDTREIAAEQRLLNEPLYQDARPKIIELIQGLQAAESPEQFMTVHREVLAEFGGRQEAVEETLQGAFPSSCDPRSRLARLAGTSSGLKSRSMKRGKRCVI
jgi:hypothetical protein